MNETEYKAMGKVAMALASAEGQLGNLKNRAASACKELEQMVKGQTKQEQKDVPQFQKALAEMKLLEKALPAALSSVGSMLKLVSDKNKIMALSVVDAKKEFQSLAKPLQVAYQHSGSARTSWELAKRSPRPATYKPPTFVVASANYCELLEHYVNEFKVALGKWSAQPGAGMSAADYDGATDVAQPVINAEGQLGNLKSRIPLGRKELEQLVKSQTKQQQKDAPEFLMALDEVKAMEKALPAALNAAGALLKFVSDEKKIKQFSVADAKKELASLGKPMYLVGDQAASVRAAWAKLRVAAKPAGYKAPTSLLASANYCEQYEHYVNEFKKGLSKWK